MSRPVLPNRIGAYKDVIKIDLKCQTEGIEKHRIVDLLQTLHREFILKNKQYDMLVLTGDSVVDVWVDSLDSLSDTLVLTGNNNNFI